MEIYIIFFYLCFIVTVLTYSKEDHHTMILICIAICIMLLMYNESQDIKTHEIRNIITNIAKSK